MKRMKFIALAALIASGVQCNPLRAINVTITVTAGTNAIEVQDQNGVDLPAGDLGLLVIDTAADGIDPIAPGTFALDSFYNASDDFIAGSVGSVQLFGLSLVQFGSEGANNAGLSAGQPFYVLWFPDSTSGDTEFDANEWYGLTRNTDWVLPTDGNPFSGSPQAPGGLATLQVIPEPSTYALIVMGLGLVVGLRFRRRK